MSSFLSIKITIQEISYPVELLSNEELVLLITFNHISSLFKAPFASLSMQILNFPITSIMDFRFYLNQVIIAESQFNIEINQAKKAFELISEIKIPEEISSPENFRPCEMTEKHEISKGTIKILIEKEYNDSKDSQISEIIENFNTVNERTLEIIQEINKNIDTKCDYGLNNLGIKIREINEYEEIKPQQIKNLK